MKAGLTKREKILVFLAIILVVIFFGYRFAIIPMNDLYEYRVQEYNQLELEKEILRIKLESEPLVQQAHIDTTNEFEHISSIYPSIMPNQDLDRFLTSLCLQSGLNPTNLRMYDPIGFTASDTEDNVDATSAALVTVTTYITVTGNYHSLKKLLDTVDSIDYILISKASYSRGEGSGLDDAATISLAFVVTMLNDIY